MFASLCAKGRALTQIGGKTVARARVCVCVYPYVHVRACAYVSGAHKGACRICVGKRSMRNEAVFARRLLVMRVGGSLPSTGRALASARASHATAYRRSRPHPPPRSRSHIYTNSHSSERRGERLLVCSRMTQTALQYEGGPANARTSADGYR